MKLRIVSRIGLCASTAAVFLAEELPLPTHRAAFCFVIFRKSVQLWIALGTMDVPPPLLERLKKHFKLSSSVTLPQERVKLDSRSNDDTTANSDSRQVDAAESPPGARKFPQLEVTGICTSNGSGCSSRVRDGDRKEFELARSSGSNRSRDSGISSNRSELCEDTGGTSSDTFWNTSSTASSNHVSKDVAARLRITGVVNEDRDFCSGKGSCTQSSRREGNRNTAETRSIPASSLFHSASSGAQSANKARQEDTISVAAGRTTLSARCAWTSSVQHCGNTRWVCHGLYTHEGFHCVYLLRSLRTPRCTYIGYSVNPLHRLRQHNGDVAHGGAWKTRRHRPWALVLVVYGFPHAVAALQFEWRWQRTLPAPRQGNPPTGGFQKRKPDIGAGLPTTTASTTPTRNCGDGRCSRVLQPFARALPCDLDRGFLTDGKSADVYINSNVTGKFEKVGTGNETSPVKRRRARRSPKRSPHKMRDPDSCSDTASVSTSDAAASGGKSLLNFGLAGEDDLQRARVGSHLLTGEEKEKRSCATRCRNSVGERTYVKIHKRATGLTTDVARVDSTNGEQHVPYRLSRTGNGIVARVGLRLQTLVALLHTEPFRHMPLGVHVVDAYTAAPYFRLLVRERKLAAPQQRQRRGDMLSSCTVSRRKSRAQPTRRCGWMLLQRSLAVSFGEPSLLLPLISRSQRRGRKKRGTENCMSNVCGSYSRADGNIEGRKTASNNDIICSSHGESDSTVEIVEDNTGAHQRAETNANTAAASGDDALPVGDFQRPLEWSSPVVDDCTPCLSHLPKCRLCGCEFLRESHERPASRCGNCLCFYHLTCLARSVFDKKPPASLSAEMQTGLDKCPVGIRENEAHTYGRESCGSERTRSSDAGEECSSGQRYPGLVPAEVKCACCDFVRSWAEVLADGVVLSADVAQEPSSSVCEENRQEHQT